MDSQSRTNLETEVKFLVGDLGVLRERLLSIGGIQVGERVFEHNVRFDTAENTLLQRGALLRLRKNDTTTMTFKGMPQVETPSEARVLEELEIQVDAFDMAAMILKRLGFVAQQVYEKYRETFRLDDVEVVLDELPFGNFVELEGNETGLKQAAAALGLDWQRRITANYLSLMASLKARRDLAFDDLTFANFRGLSISIDDVLR